MLKVKTLNFTVVVGQEVVRVWELLVGHGGLK
jgi:hypothetical protein